MEKTILLVDDDHRNIYALSAFLRSKKYNVVTARNGKEALQILKENKDFDTVLMDVMMPEMDGYTAMKEIRETLRLKKLPIIALTARALPGDMEKCIEAGANDYLSKPVNLEALVKLLQTHIPD